MKGDFYMLNKEMWKVFKKTGSIEAYLYCKEYDDMERFKNNNEVASNTLLLDAVKINSL